MDRGFVTMAESTLGQAFYYGEKKYAGIQREPNTAVMWLLAGASKGDAVSQYLLGKCKMKGEGCAVNQSEAIELFRKAADQSNDNAQSALADCYYDGEGIVEHMINGGWDYVTNLVMGSPQIGWRHLSGIKKLPSKDLLQLKGIWE